MNSDVFHFALSAFVGRVPFRPFLVELMSGQQLAVRHPEAIAIRSIQEGEIVVFRDIRGDFQLFDNTSVCRLSDLQAAPAGQSS